jgi:hypothetical protein
MSSLKLFPILAPQLADGSGYHLPAPGFTPALRSVYSGGSPFSNFFIRTPNSSEPEAALRSAPPISRWLSRQIRCSFAEN